MMLVFHLSGVMFHSLRNPPTVSAIGGVYRGTSSLKQLLECPAYFGAVSLSRAFLQKGCLAVLEHCQHVGGLQVAA